RAVRLMTLSPYRTSAGPIYKQLKLLQFNNIRKLQISVFMFKSKNKLLPKSCLQYCPINLNQPYEMRITHHFVVPQYRTIVREQCISAVGPRLWDSLPLHLTNLASPWMFKR